MCFQFAFSFQSSNSNRQSSYTGSELKMAQVQQQQDRLLMFNGKGDNVNSFLTVCELNFAANAALFPTSLSKILHVGSCRLRDTALSWFISWLGNVPPANIVTTWPAFCVEFRAEFSPVGDVLAARQEIADLMYAAPYSHFVEDIRAKFLRITNSTEADKAHTFAVKLPSGMKAFVLQQQALHANPTLSTAIAAGHIYRDAYGEVNVKAASVHAMETTGDLRALVAELAALNAGIKGQDRNFKPRPRVPDAVFKRCMEEKRCLNCKEVGHQRRACTKPAASTFPAS
jgi:hypothetical protein